ncbi:hypothetical protein LNQ81_17950 [Myroides sp. M-43]|uniref:hypothetical protein n=1 Tax=Myroides oncorhynchi TaxID=2893756 RepID=UPI001E2D2CAA|nr:hypothetical protein [Myroides oncorhynchi]MCC9044555.1 hypothetical protein [Myroides oncorhynchi]
MKTLTTDQINQIEEFLTSQYNIKYQDSRDEVLDHIACEVEELMNEGAYFSEAFKLTIAKWHSQLKPSLLMKKTPRLVVNTFIRQDVKVLTGLFCITALGVISTYSFLSNYISLIFLAFLLSASNIMLYGVTKYAKTKVVNYKTDYCKEQITVLSWFSFFLIDMMVFILYIDVHPNALVYVNPLMLFFALFMSCAIGYFIVKLQKEYTKASPSIQQL